MSRITVSSTYSTLLLLLISIFYLPSAAAVHELGLFELDGNAEADEFIDGDDWQNINDGTDSSVSTTRIIEDASPKTIFTGGRKDIQPISAWRHKSGSVPDKDDLTNAYAAAYGYDNPEGGRDLIVYFGADRFTNVGDAYMGFWFFQDKVALNDDGSFSGEHQEGDVLILIDYPQGATATPYAALLLWDTLCSKAASNDPVPSECAAKNLRLIAESSDVVSAECGENDSDDNGCAITNASPEQSFWPYMAKTGELDFPIESFYEGGVNLSQLLEGNGTCFSTFMAETRSSSSFTASLKDFVIGEFDLCGLELVKQCTMGEVVTSGDAIEYSYHIAVTNTGFGPLYDVSVEDITANQDFYEAVLLQGETAEFTGSFVTTTYQILNQAKVEAALTSGGSVEVTDTSEDVCPPIAIPKVFTIDKTCETLVTRTENNAYGLLVKYGGQVCNDSLVAVNNVVVFDDHGQPNPDEILVGDLPPKTCLPYTGEYIPVPTNGETLPVPADQVRTFTDKVKATGTRAIFGDSIETNEYGASCPICIP